MGLREGHYTARWKRKNPFPTAAMPSDPQTRDYPHKWHHSFLLAGGQLDFSSPNLCRIPTFGTPIPCCPADILGEFWASERCSGSGKHAGRENTSQIISEHLNVARCENYHRKHCGKKRAARVCRQRRGEDRSSSSLGKPRNRSAFSERNERSEMAAGSPFHSARSGKQLTSDEGESAEFSGC